ncbi:unnamed protein product [Moneuplotes crassus]|uniref:Uncharacterized protein n=1 Tax=Euplotes crassus TaxID=5936 RepID=A0AAD1U3T3_EUPCR|nr:unnamed protein product [Moneuplotes crassus]
MVATEFLCCAGFINTKESLQQVRKQRISSAFFESNEIKLAFDTIGSVRCFYFYNLL